MSHHRDLTTHLIAVALLGASGLVLASCKSVDCGEGTTEKNGTCEPADVTVTPATCGPGTELAGGVCVPSLPPTSCDPQTTEEQYDPTTGVTTCIGTAGGGCDVPLACPPPTGSDKQTICGRLFDLESNAAYADAAATGARCPTTPTAMGPCSLNMFAVDAIAFAMNPASATPLPQDALYLDDCGRYRISNVVPASPFIGIGIDDKDMANRGPNGNTVTVGLAITRSLGMATKDVEGWVAKLSTVGGWQASGGPGLAGGIYVPMFHGHRTGTDNVAGVTVTLNDSPATATDAYFTAAQTTRTTVDPAATATGANGTALISGASLGQGPTAYSGTGSLPPECAWEKHAGASLAGIVLVQVFRPTNASGQTCPL